MSSDSRPRFAVVIPCFNHGRFLAECLDYVSAQTCLPDEVIVVDDGSTDTASLRHAEALASAGRCQLIKRENGGLPAARNTGVAAANADLILVLDADDRIAPRYLELAKSLLLSRPEVGLVCGDGEYFGERTGKTNFPPFTLASMAWANCIPAMVCFRKADWVRVGGYCEDFREGWEDWDFHLSILESGLGYAHIAEVVYGYRRHDSNMSSAIDADPARCERLMRLILARHPRFFAEHSGEIALRARLLRGRYERLNRDPLVALWRKLRRTFGGWPY